MNVDLQEELKNHHLLEVENILLHLNLDVILHLREEEDLVVQEKKS
jgi:hypothetical protein